MKPQLAIQDRGGRSEYVGDTDSMRKAPDLGQNALILILLTLLSEPAIVL